jgi:hypothetical protein
MTNPKDWGLGTPAPALYGASELRLRLAAGCRQGRKTAFANSLPEALASVLQATANAVKRQTPQY